ncbi:MAG: hypothetical protein VZR26_09145, partial [Erysipelotrichaceae bacterium]|nr:hypothetical protein [Erysipelotrichaceae bacterium]
YQFVHAGVCIGVVLEYTYNNEKFTPCQENIDISLHVNIFISAIHQIDKKMRILIRIPSIK